MVAVSVPLRGRDHQQSTTVLGVMVACSAATNKWRVPAVHTVAGLLLLRSWFGEAYWVRAHSLREGHLRRWRGPENAARRSEFFRMHLLLTNEEKRRFSTIFINSCSSSCYANFATYNAQPLPRGSEIPGEFFKKSNE